MTYFIGADLGTNGIKAGLVDIEGNVIASAYRETNLVAKKPGQMSQDPSDFISALSEIIKDLLKKTRISATSVKALSIDGQMGGIIGIDSKYKSITGYDMGLDIRSEVYNAWLHKNFKEILRTKTCGSPRNLPKILWWKEKNPGVYKDVEKFVTLNSYVAGNLANLKSSDAFIDYTLLSFFGLEDIENLKWSFDFANKLNIDIKKLPQIVEPFKIVGSISASAAEITGLKKGTPITAGSGDQPAGLLGAGLVKKGTLFEVSGSSTLIFTVVDKFVPDIKNGVVMYMPSVISGQYYAFTYINGGGICLRWFRDNFLKNCKPKNNSCSENILQVMDNSLAEIPAGSDGLIFIPYFGGRQCPYDNESRGAWIGLNWGHTIEHLYKAVLESIAYDARHGIDSFKSLFACLNAKEITIAGGGANSDVWNQIRADVSGLKYIKSESFEANIRGSGIIAGYGTGYIKNIEKAAIKNENIKTQKTYKPDAKNHSSYKRYYDVFISIHNNKLKDTFSQLY